MSTELAILGWSVVLLIVQIILQAQLNVGELGLPYALSSRRERGTTTSLSAGRAERALANLLQTYPAFVGLAIGVTVAGKTGGVALWGAELWLAARILYVPVYLAGLQDVRTAVWGASIVGLLMMTYALLT